jgi:hypothetical protein
MSLEKWSIEEGWILGKMDGLQCAITCPQFMRGTTAFPITTIGLITDLRREQPPPGREGVVRVGRTHPVLRRAAAPAASEAGILRPKRLVMPNLMATPFFSDRVCGSIASCILESRHDLAYVWLVIDDEQAVLHAVVPGRGSTLGSSGEFDSSGPLDAVQSCSFG